MHVNRPQAQVSLTAAYSLKNHDSIMPIPFEEVTVHLAIQMQQRLAAFLEGPAFSGPAFSGPAFSAPPIKSPDISARIITRSVVERSRENNGR